MPEVQILLDTFKDGAFRLAVNHHIPIVPITFYDNKKRFSYVFFSGSPGKMRVKIHKFLPTEGLTIKDTKSLNEKARTLIWDELNRSLESKKKLP